ncbi:MAG: SMC-Scp complex subunit ScpB [Actinobacteria bacterium RBG_16_64_13]|nr:MAG: SMC-Scp complex subunit ScpB [Actinobacteria bacterium RBG_16_64_13]
MNDLDTTALKQNVEALLFAAGEPLSLDVLLQALSLPDPLGRALVEEVLKSLEIEFAPEGPRGFELVRLAGGWAFRTNPSCRTAVSALFELPEDVSRLSSAAMECLTIVAYLQPVSRPQIAEIRGVNSDSPMRTLQERELVTEVGRVQGGGGALLYGTTPRFEAMFGLSGLEELPALEGFALSDEQREELRRRLGLMAVAE